MSKKTVVFIGPSLPKDTVREILPEALILPPAEQGDVDYASRQLGADTIVLIDGVHTTKLPVWHKEILGVLANGARLLGAASMGALRAIECEPWGAEPIGEVASLFKEGLIDGDDEVCLVHGDESSGYRHLSIPMVNIRATVSSARIPAERKKEIIEFAKSLFYPDRIWSNIVAGCELPPKEFAEILEATVDLKAADAMQACYAVNEVPLARKILVPRNVNQGYGKVFGLNDSKVPMADGRVTRLHQIADRCGPNAHVSALNRILALEYCEMLGLGPRENAKGVDDLPYTDLSDEERINLCNHERTLARAREWLVSAGSGFHEAPAVLDWLRSVGMYEQVKEGA